MVSFADGTGDASRHVVGLRGPFDNEWFGGRGHALMFEWGADTTLRSVTATFDGTLEFRPKADGFTSDRLINWNDWEIMSTDLCSSVRFSPTGPNPLRCQPGKWDNGTYGGELRWRAAAHQCATKQLPGWENGNPLSRASCETSTYQDRGWEWDPHTGYIHASGNPALCWHKERLDNQPQQRIHLWSCAEGATAQKSWLYDEETGLISNREDPASCITAPGSNLELNPCEVGWSSQWQF
jgi:hypothetical protein